MSTSNGDIACNTITIIDDNVVEGDHSFQIQIATDPQLNIINPVSATMTIQDNESNVVVLHFAYSLLNNGVCAFKCVKVCKVYSPCFHLLCLAFIVPLHLAFRTLTLTT